MPKETNLIQDSNSKNIVLNKSTHNNNKLRESQRKSSIIETEETGNIFVAESNDCQNTNKADIKLLKEDAIYFYKSARPSRDFNPPPTPKYDINYQNTLHKINKIDIDKISKIPNIAQDGIKYSIKTLGKELGYDKYEFNLMHFWLLDILTDCIWKAQEVHPFDMDQQKMILKWVTEIFKILVDPDKNISRKLFLEIFKNIFLEIYQSISNNCIFPTANIISDIVRGILDNKHVISKNNRKTSTEASHVSVRDTKEAHSIESSESDCNDDSATSSVISVLSGELGFRRESKFDIIDHVMNLKTKNKAYNLFERTTPPRISKISIFNHSINSYDISSAEEELMSQSTSLSDITFYKADSRIPSRFKITDDLDIFDTCKCPKPKISSIKISEVDLLKQTSASEEIWQYLKHEDTNKPPLYSAKLSNQEEHQEQINEITETDIEKQLEKELETKLLQEWTYFKLLEQREKDMSNPRKGWVEWKSNEESNNELTTANTSEENFNQEKFDDEALKLHYNMLKVLIDFVFEYFYENFHFTIIKLAFRSTPNLITQKLNKSWKVPKVMRDEIKRPKATPVKKEKKSKSDKSSKKSKSDKKKDKITKKDKNKKGDASKKSKQPKTDKKSKVSKEEKAELERKKKEALKLEEENRILEENRRFMFPLADAATDTLFTSIFENWVASKSIKGKNNDKKDKKKK